MRHSRCFDIPENRRLVHLKGLTNLTTLNLGNTRVTDAGLVHLRGLTKLATLTLNGEVTDVGVTELRRFLPNVLINFRPARTSGP